MPRFVDRVVIHARAGNGGNGCASVHREKFKPLGGPDGGNGGRGGSVVLVVDPQVHTLLDFHFHPHVVAPSGKQGAGSNRDGAAGADLEVRVPDGTMVLDDNGRLLADLVGAGTRFTAAEGGRGGWATLRWRPAPARPRASRCWVSRGGARPHPGLKTVADVGLIGFPRRANPLSCRRSRRPSRRSRTTRSPRWSPTSAWCRPGAHLHRRRRARPDPRRIRRSRAGPGLPASHRALRGSRACDRLRHNGTRSRPGIGH